jgi:hypothetical protein
VTGALRWTRPAGDAVAAGASRVVTTSDGRVDVLDDVSGHVLQTEVAAHAMGAAVGDGHYAYVDRAAGVVVIRPLP